MAWPFDELIEKVYLPHIKKHGEKGIGDLIVLSVARMAFLSAYKSLPPIEQMPEKEKKEMKQYVNNLMPGKSVDEKIIACKIIYTIGTLV